MHDYLQLQLDDTEKFLCSVLTHRNALDCSLLKNLYDEVGDNRLFKSCEHNKISSIAGDALAKCFGPTNTPGHWLEASVEVENRITSYMVELDKVANLLSSSGISLIALKNSGITRGLYPYYAACPMGDIDVLVDKKDFRKAHEILLDHGYTFKFRSELEEEDIEKAEQGGGAEYSVELPDGKHLWFELQWRPVAGRWIRSDQEPEASELLKRAVKIDGSDVLLLSPEDNLIQVSLHTAKHSYVRAPGFRLHTDVDRIVRETALDWDIFLARVGELKIKTAVFFSLAFAHDLLGTPIPEKVLKALKPAGWKVRLLSRWLQKVGLFNPDGKKWGRLGYIIFVSLLYDDFGGWLGNVFPPKDWMMKRYNETRGYMLPVLHAKRLGNLVFQRVLNR